MSADAAVHAAVSALAQSPLRASVLESPLRPVATVAQLRTQVSTVPFGRRHKSARFYLFAIANFPWSLDWQSVRPWSRPRPRCARRAARPSRTRLSFHSPAPPPSRPPHT